VAESIALLLVLSRPIPLLRCSVAGELVEFPPPGHWWLLPVLVARGRFHKSMGKGFQR